MQELNTTPGSDLQDLIAANQLKAVSEHLRSWADPEIADLLIGLEKPQQILVYRALPRQRAADMFAHLEPDAQDSLLAALTDADTRVLLADLSPDDRTAMLDELPATVTRRLLQLLSPEDLAESRQLLGYPEESVGRIMTPDYIRVREEWTVEAALAHV